MRLVGQKSLVKLCGIRSDNKHMILVNTVLDLSTPNCSTTKLIEVSTFSEKHIASFNAKAFDRISRNFDFFYLGQIKVTILDVCHPKVWHSNEVSLP